jgi:hypothetical protein
MAVIDLARPGDLVQIFGETPHHCFFCGKPLVAVTVYWSGDDGRNVYLHLRCSQELGVALIYDGRRGEAALAGQRIEAGVEPGLTAFRPPCGLRGSNGPIR